MDEVEKSRWEAAGMADLARRVLDGGRLDHADGLRLFAVSDVAALGSLADRVRARLCGDRVTFNRNLHLNATNVCEASCIFCSFARLETGAPGAWTLDVDEAVARVRALDGTLVTEVHIVNGLNPDLPFGYYTDLVRAVKAARPDLHVKGFTAVEIAYYADKYGMSVEGVLEALVEAGLDSLPGGGAEIFAARARRKLCADKVDAEGWLFVHRAAHRLGLRSNCTMLFGSIETLDERVDHLLRLRALQDETGGFQAFIPLKFHPEGNRLRRLGAPPDIDALRTIAVSRLLLDNVPHVKAYWPMLGVKVAQAALHFGASDLDGTVREEHIYHMAGASTPQGLTRADLVRLVEQAGRVPAERDTLYNVVRRDDPPREVPAVTAVVAPVAYTNALPLVRFLEGVSLEPGHPSEVAAALVGGEVDLALMPVAALLSDERELRVVPDLAIGCDGPVASVLLVAETPPERWTHVLLDGASRTSVVLARLLLSAGPLSHLRVTLQEVPAGTAAGRAQGSTAALVIGDQARDCGHAVQLDLGLMWKDWTGLPFVFAVWAGPPDLDPDVVDHVRAAGARGVAALARGELDLAARDQAYLGENIRYALDDRAMAGLRRFAALARRAGLVQRETFGLYPPPVPRRLPRRDVDTVLARGAQGERLGFDDALLLERHAPLHALAAAAHLRRMALHPARDVTYIISRNVNYTNVCTVGCRFCAFWRSSRHAEAYVLTREQVREKLAELVRVGGVEVLLQGGLHPDLDLSWYEELFRWIKAEFPLDLHALSPDEVMHLARVSGLDPGTVLDRLVAAGLDSLPGGGAEILVDRVRQRIARGKTTAAEWLEVMRQAHRRGLKASCTMMFGVGEQPEDRLHHLLRLRDLQDETGGFTAFICWTFQPDHTRVEPSNNSGVEWLRVNALSRLVLDNIPNLQASWVTQGPGLAEASLWMGCNDFGSVMLEENVVSAAGTTFRMSVADVERSIRAAGFEPRRRNMAYDDVGGPLFAPDARPQQTAK